MTVCESVLRVLFSSYCHIKNSQSEPSHRSTGVSRFAHSVNCGSGYLYLRIWVLNGVSFLFLFLSIEFDDFHADKFSAGC